MPRIDGALATPLADRRRGREMVRLMVATNTIASLHRPLMLTIDEGYADEFGQTVAKGDRIVMLTLLVNALKEAVDAFWEVSDLAEELFDYIKSEPIYAQYQDLLARADRKDPASVYNRLIAPIPENVALHWDRAAAENTLAGMAPVKGVLQTHHQTERGRTVSRFPLADELYARTMLGNTTPPQLRAAIAEVRDFATTFQLVAEHLIAMFLRALGCHPNDLD